MSKPETDLNQQLRDLKKSEDALDQSVALNRIVIEFLKSARETNRRWRHTFLITVALFVACIVAIIAMFLHYESQFTTKTETVTTTITQDSGDSPGNNIYQSGENAQYVEGSGEEVNTDGTANDQDHQGDQNQKP